MTLAPPPSNGDPQPVDSMTDLRFAIARARADRRAAPSSDTPSDDDLPPIGPDGVPTNCSPETCATTPSRHCCLNDYDERLTCDQCGATETDAAPFAVRGGVAGYFDYCSRACEVAHGRGTPNGERATLTPRQEAIEAILIRHQDHAFSFVARRIDALFTAPTPVPEASGRGEVVQPTMHILQRADGEEMGEFAFWATDGPDGWDMAEDTDHDEDTVYEILACYPVARRKILRSTLCETCDGEGDGCPACAGSGECEPPDAEHMPIIARPAPSSSPVGDRGLDVTALPEWEALRAAAECGPLVRVAVEALRLLAAADREEPTDA